jgi:hypothetical protein
MSQGLHGLEFLWPSDRSCVRSVAEARCKELFGCPKCRSIHWPGGHDSVCPECGFWQHITPL